MMKKYLVIGDVVMSQSDGDRHYINARRLCDLYQVDPKECILVESSKPHTLLGIDQSKFIVLRPRFDGRYEVGQ